MAKLPNGDRVIVPESKITHYLLDLTSKEGKAKARFFLAFGFTLDTWEVLAAALKQHALTQEVTSTRKTAYGIHYNVEGELQTPDQRNPRCGACGKWKRAKRFPRW